ncbi:MAG: glycosyltransferase family 2 protein [Caldilineae bacterium]|nr:MAG: glycosyltransferase family 2 protein [Caldilineae bacterium]
MTPSHPLLSVLIPNWNGARYLPTCFRALERQTYPRLEVFLIDNASSDESVSLTRRQFPWVKIIRLPRNVGLTGALNRGIGQASGVFIAPLNNDTEVEPRWAEALVSALQAHPEAGMAASKMRLFDRRNILHSAGDAFGADGIPINRGVWQEDRGQFDGDTFIFGGCGGAVAYRKSMLDDIGLFDEDLFMYCEDVDLNWRAQLAGYKCVFAPEAVVYHHLSATGGGELASYYTGRNTLWVLAKSAPGVVWRTHFRRIVRAQLRIAVEALRAWRGAAARARLRGQLAGLAGLPRWLAKRRRVQATRRVPEAYLLSLLEE